MTAPDGPKILDFTANTNSVNQSATLRLTAIVTDPDGIDDVIGGTLKSPSGQTYGAFQTSASEGAYEIALTWPDINSVQALAPLLPGENTARVFIAEFYDQSEHRTSKEIQISFGCEDASEGVCDPNGACVNLESSSDHCGACGESIDTHVARCEAGVPACLSFGDMYCDGTCVDLDYQDNCGRCGNNCADWGSSLGVSADCVNTNSATGGRLCAGEFVSNNTQQSCIDYCASKDLWCIDASAYYSLGQKSGRCDWTFYANDNDLGVLETVYCTCQQLVE